MPVCLPRHVVLTFVVLLGGCTDGPFEGKTVVSASAPVEGLGASNKASGRPLTFDEGASEVSWMGAKVTRTHEGSFKKFSGTIDLADSGVVGSRVAVSIQTASITSDTEKLTKHLKNEDFLDVEKFPVARFVSTSIEATEGSTDQFAVTGNLTLRDTTKSITFPATIQASSTDVKVTTEFAIRRQDFGISYPGLPDDLIANEVLIRLKIHATPPS